MPKLNTDLLDIEKPVLKKGTVEVKTVNQDKSNSSLSIYDLVTKKEKSKKVILTATLDEELINKLKSFAIDANSDVSKLLTDILTPILKDIEIKEENLITYSKRKNKNKVKKTK